MEQLALAQSEHLLGDVQFLSQDKVELRSHLSSSELLPEPPASCLLTANIPSNIRTKKVDALPRHRSQVATGSDRAILRGDLGLGPPRRPAIGSGRPRTGGP